MIKQITDDIKSKKQLGTKKIRLILLSTIERNGRQVPQIVYIMEFHTDSAVLKSGKLAAYLRNIINRSEGLYSSYSVECLTYN